MNSDKPCSSKPLLLLKLSIQDLWHDRTVSFCITSSLIAVIAPLLLLFGLKFGIVSQLQDELARDPRNLEIKMLSSGSYTEEWIKQLREKGEVGFAIGQTRSLNTLADLIKDSSHFIENAEVIPTAKGDPLLGDLRLKSNNEAILTTEAARQLEVTKGDIVHLRVMRQLNEHREWGDKRLTVAGVLPPTYFNRSAIFVPESLLLSLEHFRDGHVSQELGIETGTNIENKQNLFSKARLYASNIDVVAELDDWLKKQHIETISRLAEIKNIKNINRVLGIIFNTIAITALIGCISSLIGSFLANVDRKRKNIAVLRLLGFTGPSIGLFIIIQGLIITAIAYLGGYSLYFIGSETFNQTLASNQSTENLVCKITLAHSVIAFVISQIIATAVASIGAYRAIAIQPAESLREL